MKRILMFIAALPLLALAACGGSTDHNDADVEFAQQMIPHHQQAVMMADLVLGRGHSPAVLSLATKIKAAQGPEIETMQSWLKDWDEGASTGHGDMHDMDMADGMMSDADMSSLRAAKGDAFDTQWLTMMIEHHEGAIAMARDESTNGKYLPAKNLARAIAAAQEKEIATMKGLLR